VLDWLLDWLLDRLLDRLLDCNFSNVIGPLLARCVKNKQFLLSAGVRCKSEDVAKQRQPAPNLVVAHGTTLCGKQRID